MSTGTEASGEAEAQNVTAQGTVVAGIVIDCMADRGIMHKNKAARHKSRLNAKVSALKG